MGYLVSQMFVGLLIAAAIGFAFGWSLRRPRVLPTGEERIRQPAR